MTRGAIANVERRQQILDMRDLAIGTITPTDVDGLIEYRGQALILFEVKWRDAQLGDGQEKALTRLVDAVQKGGIRSCLLVAQHTVDDCHEQIDAALCFVRESYHAGHWRRNRLAEKLTLRRAVRAFLKIAPEAKDVEIVRVRQARELDTSGLGVTVNHPPVTAPKESEINW